MAKVEAPSDCRFRNPGKAHASLEVENCLVFSVCNQGIEMVVFAPGRLRRAGRRRSLADANSNGERLSGMSLPCMTKSFERSQKHVQTVRKNADRIAERIEDIGQRKIKIGEQRVLRQSLNAAVNGSGLVCL